MNQKGICYNSGRTHFKKGFTPWNKGLKVKPTPRTIEANRKRRGISMPKPANFSETMRIANPPIGRKKKYGSAMYHSKKLRVWRDGYIMVYKPEHPTSRKCPPDYGYVLDHRYVVENHIGRDLTKKKVVHHIDGCKSNNKIENLLVCKTIKSITLFTR